MLTPMVRVQIIGTRRRKTDTIRALHCLGVVQIVARPDSAETTGEPPVPTGEGAPQREAVAHLLTRVQATLSALPNLHQPPHADYDTCSARPAGWLAEAAQQELARVEPTAQTLSAERARLEERLEALPRYEATLRKLASLVPELVDLERYTITAVWVEQRHRAALDAITAQLEALTNGQCETIAGQVEGDVLAVVLIFPKQHAAEVGQFLGRENISQVRLPTEFTGRPLNRALAEIRAQLAAIPGQIARVKADQRQLAAQWQGRLLMWQALLRDRLAQMDVCARLGHTHYTFIIEGWLPEHRLPGLQAALAREVGGELLITPLPLSAADKAAAPVAFNNPRLVRPFEPLVSLLAIPKYGGLDPTPLMAIFMPLFFGMILGDVAYGAILLAATLYARHRFRERPMLRSLAEVLALGSLWAIVFGFLFGEFLGTLGEAVGLHPLWFDRGHDVESLFLLTLGIGAGHIVLGLGLGVWESVRQRNRHKLLEKSAMLVALVALFMLVGILADVLPESFFTPATALLVVGLAVLIYSLGRLGLFLGPLELVETVGNILSYLRIAAIGLSSIYLAQVGNELAGVTGSLLLGVIIATLFHALNLVMGAFSPTIQSLRLHYVEFFGKFYEGGGEPFQPFRRSI
ncbi:MAG: V-type ATP synthase subunit I [Anaerolineae bacterium]